MLEVIAAHLIAAALSLIAWMADEALVFVAVRVLMPLLGFATAWHAGAAGDPAWMVLGLALLGAMFLPFFTPGRLGWFVLNPIVAVAYLAHLGWMAATS